MSTANAPLLFHQNDCWQRFVHWLYINEDLEPLTIKNDEIVCYSKPVEKCLQYANDCGSTYDTYDIESVIQNLVDFVSDYKCHIQSLKSLKDQSSSSIENELATFTAPKLKELLKVWTLIFTEWKNICEQKDHPDNQQITNYVKLFLENKMLGIISMKYLRYGHEIYKTDPNFFTPLYESLGQRSRGDVNKLLNSIMNGEPATNPPYERGNPNYLFCTDSSLKFSDGWEIYSNEILTKTDRGEIVCAKSTVPLLQEQLDKIGEEGNGSSSSDFHDYTLSESHNGVQNGKTAETDILQEMEETVSEYQKMAWLSSAFYKKMDPWQQEIFRSIYCSKRGGS